MKIRLDVNEQGTPISVHRCPDCDDEFTVCPPAGDEWGGCLSPECSSYDPRRDADGLFGDDSGKVVRLDDQRPHITVNCSVIGSKEVHVFPVSLVEGWISGALPIENAPPAVIKTVLYDWLKSLQ